MPYDNPMRRQVLSLPGLLCQQQQDLEPKTRRLLSTPEIFSIQRIVLTGCGDSYAAALAAQPAFEALTGIPTEVVSAMDMARLYHPRQLGFSPGNPLVIAISHSGQVARVAEAARRASQLGAFTLGITSNETSALGQACTRRLKLDIPAFESSPGVRSYMVNVLALLLLAVRFGEVRAACTMDAAAAVRSDMLAQAEALREMLPAMDDKLLPLATEWSRLSMFDFIGGGFDYATAFYGQAKMFEAPGSWASLANSEDFLHLNFFMKEPERLGTVLVANSTNPCHSRNKELFQYLIQLGRPLLVISDKGKQEFGGNACFISTPKTEYAINMPLTQFAPLALLAGYLAKLQGEEYGRGCRPPWDFAAGGKAVQNSAVLL